MKAIRHAAADWRVGRKISGPKPDGQLPEIIEVMLDSSARIGEALALRRCDIDLEQNPATLQIRGTVVVRKGKGVHRQPVTKTDSSNRAVAIPQFAARVIRQRLALLPEGEPEHLLFFTRRGTPLTPNNVRRTFRLVVEQAGLAGRRIMPHSFRETVATLISQEANVETAAEVLGQLSPCRILGLTSAPWTRPTVTLLPTRRPHPMKYVEVHWLLRLPEPIAIPETPSAPLSFSFPKEGQVPGEDMLVVLLVAHHRLRPSPTPDETDASFAVIREVLPQLAKGVEEVAERPTIVAVTVMQAVVGYPPGELPDPGRLSDGFDKALEAIAMVQRGYHAATKRPVTVIQREKLPPILPWARLRSANGITGRSETGIMILHDRVPACRRHPAQPCAGHLAIAQAAGPPKALTIEELQAIRRAASNWRTGRNLPGPKPMGQVPEVIEVMLGAAARIGEALALRRRDVDMTASRRPWRSAEL